MVGEKTKIQYVSHSWSGWRGCEHAGVGCDHCFAEAMSKRNPTVLGKWGPDGTRVLAAPNYWKQPLKWNRDATCVCNSMLGKSDMEAFSRCPQCSGNRPRVLWDLSDPFEQISSDRVVDHLGHPIYRAFPEIQRPTDPEDHYRAGLDDIRRDVFALIDKCPNLDFLLLTKRPQNIRRMWPGLWGTPERETIRAAPDRSNVWLGTSCSTQADLDANLPHLLACRDLAPVLFLSLEPLLGPLDLRSWITPLLTGERRGQRLIDWAVVGGESGANARPFDVQWARNLSDQCADSGIPYFFKQAGSNPFDGRPDARMSWPVGVFNCQDGSVRLKDRKGGDLSELPQDLRVRQFSTVT